MKSSTEAPQVAYTQVQRRQMWLAQIKLLSWLLCLTCLFSELGQLLQSKSPGLELLTSVRPSRL